MLFLYSCTYSSHMLSVCCVALYRGPSLCESKLQMMGRVGRNQRGSRDCQGANKVLCPSQAVGVEAANSDDGRPAAAGDVSLSGGELCSKNYGQQIRRQEI